MSDLENPLQFLPLKDITAYEVALMLEAYADSQSGGHGWSITINDDIFFEKYPELRRHFYDVKNASTLGEKT